MKKLLWPVACTVFTLMIISANNPTSFAFDYMLMELNTGTHIKATKEKLISRNTFNIMHRRGRKPYNILKRTAEFNLQKIKPEEN